MSAANPDEFKPKGVYELRGGIERYVKTFPEGGFWRGKNYLFDRRSEQCPGYKNGEQVEQETDSKCCLCRRKWTVYRGKFKCYRGLCGVPVIVCETRRPRAMEEPQSLTCELCKIGYRELTAAPNLVGIKRKAESQFDGDSSHENTVMEEDGSGDEGSSKQPKVEHTVHDRLFLGRLPLTLTKAKIAEALGAQVKLVHWMTDRSTGAFYGSCLVQLASTDVVGEALRRTIKVDNRSK